MLRYAMNPGWDFYGRKQEELALESIMARGRWFFCQISGRRRIGKTTLITRLLERHPDKKIIYVQIPDSDASGVLKAVSDALDDFGVPPDEFHRPRELRQFAGLVRVLCESGYLVVLDEFQYFHRKALAPFCSFLQPEVDRLRSADKATGGLFVLGSIHNEMSAILEDRRSPLFNRVTDRLEIQHLDFATLKEMWLAHGIEDSYHQLFLWSLFEGIPKFYRDCFEQGILRPSPDHRLETLAGVFFKGSSPLRGEADNWFLSEFRGRYESLLKIIAENNGCSHKTIMAEYAKIDEDSEEKQIGGYLNALVNKYQIIEKRLPIFGVKGASKKHRYYIGDNFLLSWLGAVDRQVKASKVLPLDACIRTCSRRLETVEGPAFEKMIRQLVQELSRRGDGDFSITSVVEGYWNRPDNPDRNIEIDQLLVNDAAKTLRVATCKRDPGRAVKELDRFEAHVGAFLTTKEGRRFSGHRLLKTAFAPSFDRSAVQALAAKGYQAVGLDDLMGRL